MNRNLSLKTEELCVKERIWRRKGVKPRRDEKGKSKGLQREKYNGDVIKRDECGEVKLENMENAREN